MSCQESSELKVKLEKFTKSNELLLNKINNLEKNEMSLINQNKKLKDKM